MVDEPNRPVDLKSGWKSGEITAMCVVCLGIGLLMGYLLRGSAPNQAQTSISTFETRSAQAMGGTSGQPPQQMSQKMPSLDDMKRMADKKAEPLLEKLKTDGRNPQLLNEIGLVYKSTHQFKGAADYFRKSLQYDPTNIGVRADYASCLYYTGDVDGALAQLKKSLTYDPKHAGTLMNIGIIKWKGRNDVDGAIASWETLLQYHPDFPQKDLVQQLITQAKESTRPRA